MPTARRPRVGLPRAARAGPVAVAGAPWARAAAGRARRGRARAALLAARALPALLLASLALLALLALPPLLAARGKATAWPGGIGTKVEAPSSQRLPTVGAGRQRRREASEEGAYLGLQQPQLSPPDRAARAAAARELASLRNALDWAVTRRSGAGRPAREVAVVLADAGVAGSDDTGGGGAGGDGGMLGLWGAAMDAAGARNFLVVALDADATAEAARRGWAVHAINASSGAYGALPASRGAARRGEVVSALKYGVVSAALALGYATLVCDLDGEHARARACSQRKAARTTWEPRAS